MPLLDEPEPPDLPPLDLPLELLGLRLPQPDLPLLELGDVKQSTKPNEKSPLQLLLELPPLLPDLLVLLLRRGMHGVGLREVGGGMGISEDPGVYLLLREKVILEYPTHEISLSRWK